MFLFSSVPPIRKWTVDSKVDGLTVSVNKSGTSKLTLIDEFPWHKLDRFLKNSSKIEHLVKNDIQRIMGRD